MATVIQTLKNEPTGQRWGGTRGNLIVWAMVIREYIIGVM